MKKITLSVVLSCALAYASNQNVEAIHYDGMVHISSAVAKRLNTVKIGQPLDPFEMDRTVKIFFNQGYFDDIWADEENATVTFHFKEKPIISKLELKGYKENNEEEKKTLLQIDKGSLYDPARIENARKRIVDALNQEGKIDSVVEVETKKLDNGSMQVTFIANEGGTIIIKTLKYLGVSGVNPKEFEKTIANKAHQFMGWMWGRNDGKMKLGELQYDPMRIRDYYMQKGYLDAQVDQPFTTVDLNHYEASIAYSIFEGDVYKTSDILVFQDTNVINDQALLKVIQLEKNKPFNIKTFREDADRIKTKIADLGYAYVQVQPDLRKDKEAKTVEVIYRIAVGKKVHIHDVIISGNNRTLDRVVRRELYLAPGDPYSLTNLKDSRNALGRTGYFQSNTIEEKRLSDESMDLVVQAKETPTGNIQVGGGYGSFGGILLSAAISDRNIFGSGLHVGINVQKSQLTKNYAFTITNPRLNDSDFSGNFSINSSSTDYSYSSGYKIDSQGVGVGTGHRFNRYVTGYLGYNYSDNRYSNLNNLSSFYNPLYYQNYSKSAPMVSLTFDNTDDYYVPREGMVISQSLEKAGVGGTANFWKSRTNFGIYQGLQKFIDADLILRYKARFSYASDTGNLPINEKFFMGGIGSVRGYRSYSLAPNNGNDANLDGRLDLIGGTEMFSNSFELSVPLVPEAKMRATGFFDYGMIGQGTLGGIKRGGYGVALEWFSPVGPLQLVFSEPYGSKSGDNITHFEFTIGQRF